MPAEKPKGALQFLRQSGLSVGLRLSWAVLNYLGVLLLARWFAPSDYGHFALILTIVTFLAMVGGLGTRTALVRFLGQYQATSKPGHVHGVVRYALRSVVLLNMSILAVALIGIWVGWMAGIVAQPLIYSLGLLMLPAFSLSDTFGGIARSFNAIVVALAPRDVFWRAGIIGLGFVATLSFVPATLSLELFLTLSAVLLIALVVWQGRASWIRIPQATRTAPIEMEVQQWRRVAGPIWLASVATVSMRTLDVLALGLVLDKAELGAYFATSRTAALTGFVLLSINQIIGPQISRAYHGGKSERLKRLLVASSALSFAPALVLFIIYVFAGHWILGLFGEQFVAFYPVLIVLSGGHLASSFCGSVGLLLDMTGNERVNTRILLSTSLISSLCMVLGAYLFGAMGTAVAAALGLATWNLLGWSYAKRRIGYETSILGGLRTRKKT